MAWANESEMIYERAKLKKNFLIRFSVPIEVPLKNQFSLIPEINFIQKGIKAELIGGHINYMENMKLSYLEIPLLTKLGIINKPKVKLGFIIGPSLGYALSGSVNGEQIIEGEQPYKWEDPVNFDTEIKRFDFGINAGINIQLIKETGNIVFDIRYQHGLSNNVRDYLYNQSTVFKSRGLIFSAGYMIPFKK